MNKFIAFLPRYFVSSMHRISMEPFFVAIHWLTLFFNALNSSIHHSHIHSSLFSSKFFDSKFVFTNDENRCFGVRWTFKKIKKVFCRTLHCGKLKYRNDSETIEMRLVRTCVTLLTSHRVLNPKNMWSKEKNVGLFFLFCSLMLWSTTHTKQQYTNWCVCALCSVVKRFARYYTQQCIVKSERLRERWIEHKEFTIWETYTCTLSNDIVETTRVRVARAKRYQMTISHWFSKSNESRLHSTAWKYFLFWKCQKT